MEARTRGNLERGAVLTRRGIRAEIGGNSRASFPTVDGRVVGLCLTREKNPRAPLEVLVGPAEGAVRLARSLAAGDAVPVFVRNRPDVWEYVGRWGVRAIVDDPAGVREHAGGSGREDVALVLLLEERLEQRTGAASPGPLPCGGDGDGDADR